MRSVAARPPISNTVSRPPIEHRETFACFGSECTVVVSDRLRSREAASAVGLAKDRLLGWHEQFSRFERSSELARLNADPRSTVAVSPMMRRVVGAAIDAARATGGLVDVTLLDQIEQAGYERHLEATELPLVESLALAPPRAPAHPHPAARWHAIEADRRSGSVTRPPGLRIDAGGIAKGVFADELCSLLAGFDAFAVDCAGDIRLGGAAGILRPVHVASPFDDSILHTFELTGGALATSGIGKRSWLADDGRPAHHLLDPATGRPAFTGIVQATALAPSAAHAEALSKAAILSGPERAPEWLVHGGLLVFEDGTLRVVDARE
jgi:FAD:protein FMN transferase